MVVVGGRDAGKEVIVSAEVDLEDKLNGRRY
jgi:hypothetical protein